MDTKPERKLLLIGWLMGVEQNSVFLSRILVVGCVGLSDCEELLGVGFFLGGLFLSLKNNEGRYPVGGGKCLTFCHKFVILDTKNRHQMVTLYYYVSLLGKLFSNFPDSLSPKFLSSPVRVNR